MVDIESGVTEGVDSVWWLGLQGNWRQIVAPGCLGKDKITSFVAMARCGHRKSQEKVNHASGPNCMKSVLMLGQSW